MKNISESRTDGVRVGVVLAVLVLGLLAGWCVAATIGHHEEVSPVTSPVDEKHSKDKDSSTVSVSESVLDAVDSRN